MPDTNNVTKPVLRTSEGLRDALFDELDMLRSGTSNPARANSVAKLAQGVIETVRMEVDVHKHMLNVAGKPQPQVEAAAKPKLSLDLGSR